MQNLEKVPKHLTLCKMVAKLKKIKYHRLWCKCVECESTKIQVARENRLWHCYNCYWHRCVFFFVHIVFGACVWYVLHRLNFIPLLLLLISLHLLSFDPFNSRLFCISFAFLTLEILVSICDIYVYEMIQKKKTTTDFVFFLRSCCFIRFSHHVFFLYSSSLGQCAVCLRPKWAKKMNENVCARMYVCNTSNFAWNEVNPESIQHTIWCR